MSWRIIGMPTAVIANNAIATKFRDMEPWNGDRHLSLKRTRDIASAIEDKCFRSCVWASVVCLEDGKTYRLNGKHSSHVMAELNGSCPPVPVVIERYECDFKGDVSDLYATFDTRSSVRSSNDVVRAFTGLDEGLCAINTNTVDLCAAGIDMFFRKFANARSSAGSRRGQNAVKNRDFILWYADLFGCRTTNTSFFFRTCVVAAVFACYTKDKSAAADFFTRVITGTDPTPIHPSRALRDFLMQFVMRDVRSNREAYAKCIHAWNAFRRGSVSQKTLKYFGDADLPDAI